MSETTYTAFVVSHTHWDREWHRPFQQFRMRLVEMTDDLLDLLECDPDYKAFYWDGQTVVIDDYLEIRPENAERLRRHFASGRLYTGPWYVQPDEFLVSGESFLRNLFVGRRMCEEWGTGAAVGYAPDAFGHISQMPQILRGFGMDNAVLFRGITADQVDAEFDWQSPDGSSVLCVKMPDDNAYSNFYYCFRDTLGDTDRDAPIDPAQVLAEATVLLDNSIHERPTTRNLLWMDGVDHIFAQPRTPEIIRTVNDRMGEQVRTVHSTLPAFLEALRADMPELKTVVGELRVSNRRWKLQALLAHVASSRIHLKQLNHRCETLLERWAEPWSALAWRLGRPYPEGFLREAWRQLLLNQPHDSLCGCSVDQVHRDMLPRYEQCLQIGETLTADAFAYIAEQVNTLSSIQNPKSSQESNRASAGSTHAVIQNAVASLVVFNPLGWARERENIEVVVELPADGAPQGIAVAGSDGTAVPCVVEPMKDCHRLSQAPHDIPAGQHLKRWKIRFPASVPAFGYAAYTVIGQDKPNENPSDLRGVGAGLENEYLRVEVAANGTFTLTDKATGQVFRNCLLFEDGGDFGDGYNYVRPPRDQVVTTAEQNVTGGQGLWSYRDETVGRLFLQHVWYVPSAREGEGRNDVVFAPVNIQAALSLAPGAKRLDIALTVTNAARDHRLRVLFPTGLSGAAHSHAEQAFDVVARPIEQPDCADWREPQPSTGPQKTFVNVSDGTAGLCLINRGIPEYEVKDDPERTIALTLLRCTGSGVGAPEEQEEGQMQETYTFDLALLPHAGGWESAQVWREAHAFNVPMRAAQTSLHEGSLPVSQSFLSVTPGAMVPTAVKRSEDGSALVVRAVNYGSDAAQAQFGSSLPFSTAESARLDESRLEILQIANGTVSVDASSRRIVTVRWSG
jgi:alpha-mannosidase